MQGPDFCVIVRQKNLLNRIPGITDDQKRWGNIFSYNRERSPSCFVIFSNEKQLLRWQTHRSLIIWNKTFALVIYSFFVNHFLKFTAVTVVTDLHLTCLHCNGCEMPHSQVYEAGTTGFRKWLYTVHLLFLFLILFTLDGELKICTRLSISGVERWVWFLDFMTPNLGSSQLAIFELLPLSVSRWFRNVSKLDLATVKLLIITSF